MKSYAAFLRGVSPMNTKMPELKRAFEVAGFTGVRTVLSSGNVVFGAPPASEAALERKAEAAMKKHLGYAYLTIVASHRCALQDARNGPLPLSTRNRQTSRQRDQGRCPPARIGRRVKRPVSPT